MKMNVLLLLTLFLSPLKLQARDIQVPIGEFHCALSYEESYAISIEEGDDFPTFGGHYDNPIKRDEILKFRFSLNEKDEPLAYAINPEALPNWLLISEPYYDKQNSWSYRTETGIIYQINWNGTWYFGSSLDLETKAFDGKTLKMDITFHDNDSVGELHRWVKCRLI